MGLRALLAVALLVFPLTGCFSDKVATAPGDRAEGAVSLVVDLQRIGALAKTARTASGPGSRITLARLRLTLSAIGEKDVQDTFSLSGTDPVIFAKTYSGLAADKRWNILARSYDSRDSVIHIGQTSVLVENRKTSSARLDLASRFSSATVRFFPIRDSVGRVVFLVDNVVKAQESFERQARVGDTLSLGYDYLDVGRRNIKLQAWGVWNGTSQLLYAADTTVIVVPGENARHQIELRWVGPKAPPAGAVAMTVALGSVGHTLINGNLVYSHEDGFRYWRVEFTDEEPAEVKSGKQARMRLKTAFFKADGKSYPQAGGFEIVSLPGVEAVGDPAEVFSGKADKRGVIRFKDLDWVLVLDLKVRLRFQEAVVEGENFQEFAVKGRFKVYAADDLLGPWFPSGQMDVSRLLNGETFKLH